MSEGNFPTYNFQIDLANILSQNENCKLSNKCFTSDKTHNVSQLDTDQDQKHIGNIINQPSSSPSLVSSPTKSTQKAFQDTKDVKMNTSIITHSPSILNSGQQIFVYNTLPQTFTTKPSRNNFDNCFFSEEAKQAAAHIKDTMAVIAGRRQMFFEEPSQPVCLHSPSQSLPSSSPSHSASFKHPLFYSNISSLTTDLSASTLTTTTTTKTSSVAPINSTNNNESLCKNIKCNRLSLKDQIKNCPPLEIYTTSPIVSPTQRSVIASSPPSQTSSCHQVIFQFQDSPPTNVTSIHSITSTLPSSLKSNTKNQVAKQETSTQNLEHCQLNNEVISHYHPVSEDVPKHQLATCKLSENKDKVVHERRCSEEQVRFYSVPEAITASSCFVNNNDTLAEQDEPSTKSIQMLSSSLKVTTKGSKFFPDSPLGLTTDLKDAFNHPMIATGEEYENDPKKNSELKKAAKADKKSKKNTNKQAQTPAQVSSIKNSPVSKHKKSPSNKDVSQKESWKGRMARTIKRYGSSNILLNSEPEPKTHKGVFGAPLETLQPSTFDPLVPLIVEVCVKIVEEKGLDNQGLYRVPGNTGALKELQEEIDKDEKGLCLESDKWQDVNLVTSLLKLFFRKIPDPLITDELYNAVIESTRVEKSERRMLKLKKLLHELPERNFNTFRYICKHLSLVTRHEENNKMDAHNLAIMFGPTLIRPHDNNIAVMARNMGDQCRIVETIISNSEWFFSSWDEDVHVPDDGSGDINNALDELMVAKAQNMDQKPYKSFSTLPSLSSQSLSSSSSSFNNHHLHHILPYITLSSNKKSAKNLIKRASDPRSDSPNVSVGGSAAKNNASKQSKVQAPSRSGSISSSFNTSINDSFSTLKKMSITSNGSNNDIKTSGSYANLQSMSKAFFSKFTKKPLSVTKSAESGISEAGKVASKDLVDVRALSMDVLAGSKVTSRAHKVIAPGVVINLKVPLNIHEKSSNKTIEIQNIDKKLSSENTKLFFNASNTYNVKTDNRTNTKMNLQSTSKCLITRSAPFNAAGAQGSIRDRLARTLSPTSTTESSVQGLVKHPKYRIDSQNYLFADNR